MRYSELKDSEFYHFFNLIEQKKEKFNSNLTKLFLKTGGFQEHIDIFLYINKNIQIKKAELFLERQWIGNKKSINPFGTDISKGFINYFLPSNKDSEFKKHLVHDLFNLRGENQVVIPLHQAFRGFEESTPEIIPYLDVYRNTKKEISKTSKNFELFMQNIIQDQKERLLISIKLF
ncbi:MAG: hypothetical protein GF329_13075 [Candidatus Lokiarchaeota archaeon]|nr:hypothetical protein [Candidatus Lokiarchaeota archaeon]